MLDVSRCVKTFSWDTNQQYWISSTLPRTHWLVVEGTMNLRASFLTTFAPEEIIQPIYTGGDIALESKGRILATCLGEEAVLTHIHTGKLLNRLEGVGA